MAKKIPMRQCVGCGGMNSKKEMLRIVKTPEDEIVLDITGKKNGRGAYICKSRECLAKARKAKRLEKALETQIPENVYDDIETRLD